VEMLDLEIEKENQKKKTANLKEDIRRKLQ